MLLLCACLLCCFVIVAMIFVNVTDRYYSCMDRCAIQTNTHQTAQTPQTFNNQTYTNITYSARCVSGQTTIFRTSVSRPKGICFRNTNGTTSFSERLQTCNCISKQSPHPTLKPCPSHQFLSAHKMTSLCTWQ